MQRRVLDYIFAVGGALLAALLLILGFVLADEAAFAREYVKTELGEQKITFAATDKLTEEDTTWKPGSACLVDYAGQQMQNGKQAECYANYYINLHIHRSATAAGYDGGTYATMGTVQTALRAEIAAANRTAADAETKGDTAGADRATADTAAAQKKLDAATSLRNSLQTGETLRGLLLTSYGFSIFGEKAGLAGTICFAAGGLIVLLSIAGFVHAIRTPATTLVGAPPLSAAAQPA